MPEFHRLEVFHEPEKILSRLCTPVREWFEWRFPGLTDPQRMAIPHLLDGEHLLLCSPTGSGKTMTAFLGIIDSLIRRAIEGELEEKVHCIYISPIKALANDIQRNLIQPLEEMRERFLPRRTQQIRVKLRTGDTSQADRQKMLRKPPHILITTPESLGLAISSPRFVPLLEQVEHFIVDELHSLVPTKRGSLLALTMARLDQMVHRPLQRIGISATMEPLDEVAKYLVHSDSREKEGTSQIVNIAKISVSRELDLDILLPTKQIDKQPVKEVLETAMDMIQHLVEAHTTTLVFANTRRMTETIVQKLRLLGVEGVEGHHGSMDKRIRLDVEKRMKYGELRAVVSSSSLEMGIDIGSVDLVVQVGTPGQVGTALQRIGRAGHHVGGVPRARLIPISADDLVEMVALQTAILGGDMDRLHMPVNCLDVLAQFLVGLTIHTEVDLDDAYELVTSTWSFRDLPYDDYIEVLDLLEDERRIWLDYEENVFGKRGYTRMIYYTNVGTIAPDNNYLVFDSDGSVIGQLSSSFVSGLRTGDVFLLGGQTYRVHTILSNRLNVTPITGHRPTVPSWSGEARSRSRELSERVLEVEEIILGSIAAGEDPLPRLRGRLGLSAPVANAIIRHLGSHAVESLHWPGKERIIIEQVVGGGTPTYLILTGRGRSFNLAFGHFLGGLCHRHEIGLLEISTDENGIMLRLTDEFEVSLIPEVVSGADWIEVFENAIQRTELFKRRFSEVCGRSLVVPRRIGADEVSPQKYQRDVESLYEKHRQEPESVLIREALNEIFQLNIDRHGLEEFLDSLRDGDVELVHIRTRVPSPLAMALFSSAFEDLLAMRTRAYLIKDIDPDVLRRLLGDRSLSTEWDAEQLEEHYRSKSPVPKDAEGLLLLMHHGGGLSVDQSNSFYANLLENIDPSLVNRWLAELAERGEVTMIQGTGDAAVDHKWYSCPMAEVHGTLAQLSDLEGDDIREARIEGLTYEVATEFKGHKPVKFVGKELGDPYEMLRRKLIVILGGEGPQTLERFEERLPFSRTLLESILHELEVRNRVSIGFFRNTQEAEYILRIDEYRITGGDSDVIEARDVQNLIMHKSFIEHSDPYEAISAHLFIQKPAELLPRVKDFSFGEWKDLLLDKEIVMGRLMHNRIAYTLKDLLPIILSLRPSGHLTEREEEVLDLIPEGELPTRVEILAHYPRGEEHKALLRDVKSALSGLERDLRVVKQFEEVDGRRRRLTMFRRVTEAPLSFENGLLELIKRIGPIQLNTLRLHVGHPPEELGQALRALVDTGALVKIRALKPDPVVFYCAPVDEPYLRRPHVEDRTLRILTQSDPFCSRFIHEVRYVLKRGWYHPVLKGVDPIGKVFMYKINDYLEVKDIQIPTAYLGEFCKAFSILLDNYRDQLVDVAVLTHLNGLPILEMDDFVLEQLAEIGFLPAGERLIRGGVMEPRPRNEVIRALFHEHGLHQKTRWENETLAIKDVVEIRDDFALRGRCHMYRMDLKAMCTANRLHQGVNLHGHQVRARYPHFQKLLAIRGADLDDETDELQLEALEFFSDNSDPKVFMDRHALRRSEFRKVIQPLVRAGHMVQDDRNGFRTIDPLDVEQRLELRRSHLTSIVRHLPVVTLRQLSRLAGPLFRPEELKGILHAGEKSGELVKGFLIDDVHEVCWGRPDMLEDAPQMPQMRDFVLPPSDPLMPYFGDILRQRFGFGSAYLVFKNETPVAAFKANTRNRVIDITDYVGEESGLRVVKEFAWEHQLPIHWSTRIGQSVD